MKMLAIIVLASSLLSACNYAPQAGDSYNKQSQFVPQSNKVYFDSFTKIPKLATPSQYMVRLHNDSKDNYKINSAKLSATVQNSTNNATLDNNECVELMADSQCGFIVDFPANNSASYSLSVEVEDSKHQRQIIKTALIADEVRKDQGGINYSLPTRVSSHDGNYHLAIPVYFSQDFESINTSKGDLYCRNGYHSGSSCTYYIDGYTSKDYLILTTLNGTKDDQSEVKSSGRVFVTKDNTKFPWVILSAPQDVEQDDTNHTAKTVITVFNSGEADVTDHDLRSSTFADGVSLGLSTCPSVITAGAICTIEVLVNVEKNSSSMFLLTYTGGAASNYIPAYYRFLHFVNIKEPILIWDNSNSNFFENSIPNEQREQQITLTAKNISFDKVTISHDDNPDFEIVGSQPRLCEGNQVTVEPLTKDESCTITIKYKPLSIQNTPNNFHFVASGTYQESNGITRTFAYPLEFSYSAPFNAVSFVSINNNTPISLSTTTDDPTEVSVQLSNSANYPITLSAPGFSPAINGATIDLDQCGQQPITLGALGSCTFKIKYAPQATQATTSSSLQISVLSFNGANISANNLVEQIVNYSAVAPTTPSFSNSREGVVGATTENPAGTYWLLSGNTITLSYKIMNTTANSTAKNIRISSLPAGWSSDINDCTNKTLANGQSCTIKLSASYADVGLKGLNEASVIIAFEYGKGGAHQASVALGTRVANIQVFKMPQIINVTGNITQADLVPGDTTTTTFTLGGGGYPGMPAYRVAASSIAGLSSNSCDLNYNTRTCNITIRSDASLSGRQVTVNFSSTPALPLDRSQLQLNFSVPFNLGDAERPALFEAGTGTEKDCVLDKLTGLMWPKANIPGVTDVNFGRDWGRAFDAVKTLNRGNGFCGHKDWFVPNINELMSLSNQNRKQSFHEWLITNSGIPVANNRDYFSSTISSQNTSVSVVILNGVFVIIGNPRENYIIPARRATNSAGYNIRQTGNKNRASRDDTDGATLRGEIFVTNHFEPSSCTIPQNLDTFSQDIAATRFVSSTNS